MHHDAQAAALFSIMLLKSTASKPLVNLKEYPSWFLSPVQPSLTRLRN